MALCDTTGTEGRWMGNVNEHLMVYEQPEQQHGLFFKTGESPVGS